MTIAQQSPTTIHEHALVTRHTRQLEELGEKLRAAQGHETQLVAEQEQLRRAQHEAGVAVAMGDAAPGSDDADRMTRLRELATEIDAARTDAAALSDAHQRLTTLAAATRQQAQAEIDGASRLRSANS
jgi:hypothetical protein